MHITDDEAEIVLMGDQLRLENVLTQFMTHAAKSAPEHSQVKVMLTMKVRPVVSASTASPSYLLPTVPSANNTVAAAAAASVAGGGGGGGIAGGGGSGVGLNKGRTSQRVLTASEKQKRHSLPLAPTSTRSPGGANGK